MGLPAEQADLAMGTAGPVADLAFIGRGVKGKPVSVGIEFKKLGEYVASMRTERLQGAQLPAMRDAYDMCWLIVEGEILYSKSGGLERRVGRKERKPLHGGMGVSELLKRTMVLHICGGLNPWNTQNRTDTLKYIEALYRTWTDVDQDEHKSHIAIYQAPPLTPISKRRMALKAWDDVGMQVSLAAELKFGSVKRAANATVQEWASLETTDKKGKVRRLGEKTAQGIVTFLESK